MKEWLNKVFDWGKDGKKDIELKTILGVTVLIFSLIGVSSPSIDHVYQQTTFSSGKSEKIDLRYCLDKHCFMVEGNAEEIEMLGKKQKRYSSEILDLHAQKRMAHWTIAIAFLTFVGVLLLARTLQESKNSAEKMIAEQRDIGRKQVRAYPFLDSMNIMFHAEDNSNSSPPHWLTAEVFLKNSGQSPWRIESGFLSLRVGRNLLNVVELDSDLHEVKSIGAGEIEPIEFDVLLLEELISFEDLLSSQLLLCFHLRVYGKNVFDTEVTISDYLDMDFSTIRSSKRSLVANEKYKLRSVPKKFSLFRDT